MRSRHSDRTIWIDAVCINQKDTVERGEQVAVMGQVYEKTTRNLIWLGPSDENTAEAIQTMDAVWDDIIQHTDNLRTFLEATLDNEAIR